MKAGVSPTKQNKHEEKQKQQQQQQQPQRQQQQQQQQGTNQHWDSGRYYLSFVPAIFWNMSILLENVAHKNLYF